jgi:hypothetical protein
MVWRARRGSGASGKTIDRTVECTPSAPTTRSNRSVVPSVRSASTVPPSSRSAVIDVRYRISAPGVRVSASSKMSASVIRGSATSDGVPGTSGSVTIRWTTVPSGAQMFTASWW